MKALANLPRRFALRNEQGQYYVFWDPRLYGEPTFSRSPADAKLMTAQGCASVKRMLEDPRRWGTPVERVDMSKGAATQPLAPGPLPPVRLEAEPAGNAGGSAESPIPVKLGDWRPAYDPGPSRRRSRPWVLERDNSCKPRCKENLFCLDGSVRRFPSESVAQVVADEKNASRAST